MRWQLLSTTGPVAVTLAAVLAATPGVALAHDAQQQTGSAPAGGASSPAPAAPASAAQDAAPAPDGPDIMVTAQRREERLFDVPLTVRVITGDQIDKQNMATMRDVIEHSPQVSFQQTGDQRTDTLSIRGISSVSNASGVEPDAAIVIDGETLARTMEMNHDAFDIERVEILEGPQGTLFGKNAVAGLVNIVTRGPSFTDGLSGRVSIVLAQDDEQRYKASINVPINDNLAAYFTGYRSYMGGWEKNVHPGQPNGGAEKGWGLRGQLLWSPDDSLKITLKAEITQKSTGIIPYAFKSLTSADVATAAAGIGGANAAAYVSQFTKLLEGSGIYLSADGGKDIVNGTKSYLYDDRPWDTMRNRAVSLTLEKKFDGSVLHYLGTYRYYNLFSNDNEWGVSAPYLTNSSGGLDTQDYAGPSTEKTMQQEVRLESNTGGPLSWGVGAFYYYNDNYHRETTKACTDATYGNYYGGGFPTLSASGFDCSDGYTGHYSINDFQTEIKTHNEAIFGNAEYKVTEKGSVFGGARMLWEQQDMMIQHYDDDNTAKYFFDSANPFGKRTAHDSRSAFIWKLGAKYNFGPVMVYGSYSTGFKGVSWDNYGLASAARAVDPLKPEKPTQWEAGMRGNVAGGKFDWQISVFRLADKDFQARTILRDPSFQLAVVDAGTAVTEGAQIAGNLVVAKGVRIGGGYFWLPKAKLVDDVEFQIRANVLQDYKGTRLPNAPKNSANAYVDYHFGFPVAGTKSDIRIEYRYRGRQQSVLTLDPLQEVAPYGVFDGYYTLAKHDDSWSLTVYAMNLLNKLYYQRAYEPAVMGWSTGQMAYLPRDYKRYVGATFNYKF